MKMPPFAVTYDYRCPFARNAHEHLATALRDGASWDVDLVPFSLSQSHLEEGEVPVWDDPQKAAGLMATEAGLVVMDRRPDRFMDVHLALFSARHDEGRDLRDEAVIRDVLGACGVDADAVFDEIADGWPRAAFRKAHEGAVASHQVFGVPTFVAGDDAVFVRIMQRPTADASASRALVEHVIGLLAQHPELNEFKHTTVPR